MSYESHVLFPIQILGLRNPFAKGLKAQVETKYASLKIELELSEHFASNSKQRRKPRRIHFVGPLSRVNSLCAQMHIHRILARPRDNFTAVYHAPQTNHSE